MKNEVRTALSAATLLVALAIAGASSAHGQVFFQGNFPVRDGRVLVGLGVPSFSVGSYVPSHYAQRIYYRRGYGYGFSCEAGWVPVKRYRSRWIILERPRSYGYRSDRRYGNGRYDRYDGRYDNRYERRYDNRDDRRYDSYRDREQQWQGEENWR